MPVGGWMPGGGATVMVGGRCGVGVARSGGGGGGGGAGGGKCMVDYTHRRLI